RDVVAVKLLDSAILRCKPEHGARRYDADLVNQRIQPRRAEAHQCTEPLLAQRITVFDEIKEVGREAEAPRNATVIQRHDAEMIADRVGIAVFLIDEGKNGVAPACL